MNEECVRARFEILILPLMNDAYNLAAEVTGAPIGTVMSRRARGRDQLTLMLADQKK